MTAALNLNQLARMSAGSMLNCMLEGIAIGLFAWMLLRVVGRRNSSTRFAVWFFALLAIAALPVLGGMASSAGSVGSAITVPGSWATAIFFVWAVIAGVALFRVGVGLLQLNKLRRSCSAIDAAALDPVLRATLQEFQAVRPVALCQSDRLQVPTAIGFVKPMVVIPAWAMRELSIAELNSILIHELAHLRRRDDWTNLAQQVLKALLFFHPAVWWIEGQLALEREMACDDAVLAETANPRDYAQCLISMAEKSFMRRGLALAQAGVNRMRQTSLRVSQILDVNRSSATRVWKPALYSVAAFFVVCLVSLSHAPELVAFQDPMKDSMKDRMPYAAIASATPASVMLASAADSNSPEKRAVATAASLRAESAGLTDQPATQAAEKLLQAHRMREGTSSLVPQSAENKSGLQPRRRRMLVQASFSAAGKAALARRTPIDDEAAAPQAIFVVLQSAQYDQAGPMFVRICVWRVTVLNLSRTSLETTTYLIHGFGKGTPSAVPLRANNNAGFSPWETRQCTPSVGEIAPRILAKQI
jgi:beta-lactamase regulating signal transducer with metallopeptidase domain